MKISMIYKQTTNNTLFPGQMAISKMNYTLYVP